MFLANQLFKSFLSARLLVYSYLVMLCLLLSFDFICSSGPVLRKKKTGLQVQENGRSWLV